MDVTFTLSVQLESRNSFFRIDSFFKLILCALCISHTQIQKDEEELAEYKAKDALDESNKQINIVWNALTKNIRQAVLPEQREWLKKRENDCGIKASVEEPNNNILQKTIKLRCMAAMTEERTIRIKTENHQFCSITSHSAYTGVSLRTPKLNETRR